MNRRPATMNDVAKRAGVSQRTVSNVVNNHVYVSEKTRQKVLRAIKELGYRPNVIAQGLRTGQTKIIALAVPNVAWPYYGEIAHAVQTEARANGLTVLMLETDAELEKEQQVLNLFGSNLIDGIIFSAVRLRAEDLRDLPASTPVVLIGHHQAGVSRPNLLADVNRAAQDLVEHLYQRGARSFLLQGSTSTPMTSGPGLSRQAGFVAGLEGLGSPEVTWEMLPSGWTYREGFDALREWLTDHRPPDAVICMNDIMAIGAIRALADAGIRVPDDVLVTGWDNTRESSFMVPSLTTIGLDKAELARRAVAYLLAEKAGKRSFPEKEFVPHELLVRESTGGQQD